MIRIKVHKDLNSKRISNDDKPAISCKPVKL